MAVGEPAYFMPAAFPYVAAMPPEPTPHQGNPIHALGESISFGRFMSESLAWEKWSTFNHNRYVEEAERYAQPGSVAQKKAFFEAHYKKIAAKKAAALLEQENAADNASPEPESDGAGDSQAVVLESQISVDEHKLFEIGRDSNPEAESSELEVNNMEASVSVTENKGLLVENHVMVESSNPLKEFENHIMVCESEQSRTPQPEKPLLQLQGSNSDQDVSSSMNKKKPVLSALKSSSVCRRAPRDKVPHSPYTSTTPRHPSKENVTPATCKSTTDYNRTATKSQRSLSSFNSTREPDKSTTPFAKKNGSSEVARNSDKEPNYRSTPLRTPITANVKGLSKHPSATPISENRRTKTIPDPTSGSKATGTRWRVLSAVSSKSLSACRKKLQSPSVSTPFTLRTEERAARRKQKLEEKFNAKEGEKEQLQTKLKEKAETELKKLSQSFCFKARPLPDFYKERGKQQNQLKKTPPSHHHAPKPARNPTAKRVQDTVSQPPPTFSTKINASKPVVKKNNQTPTHALKGRQPGNT